ncbi:MAG: PP2C family protein-serine/threonine phosphatase [Calditrichia bacterium]
MATDKFTGKKEPGIGQTLWNDVRRGDLKRTLWEDIREVQSFFLSREQKAKLENYNWFRRAAYLTVWMLKILILKLTPVRRLLLVIALVFLVAGKDNGISGTGQDFNYQFMISLFIIIFLLLLELKDKLLAREELEAGKAVQSALMPRQQPPVPGWDIWLFSRSANEVGGDLLDFLQVNENEYRTALGDVSGKGLGAALIMAKLQATLRALAQEKFSLDELGRKVNTIFCRDTVPSCFVSLIYLQICANNGAINYINAGHLPPLVLNKKGIRELAKGEAAIGLSEGAVYREKQIVLESGEMLLVYSDGLTEARNLQGEFFGDNRLHKMLPAVGRLSAASAGRYIVDTIEKFMGEARATDDLSLMILRRL